MANIMCLNISQYLNINYFSFSEPVNFTSKFHFGVVRFYVLTKSKDSLRLWIAIQTQWILFSILHRSTILIKDIQCFTGRLRIVLPLQGLCGCMHILNTSTLKIMCVHVFTVTLLRTVLAAGHLCIFGWGSSW